MSHLYKIILIGLLIGGDPKELKMILKPTVKVDDKVYFDNREVDVEAWLSYYTWKLNHEGYDSAIKVLPDSNALENGVWDFIKAKSSALDNNISTLTGQPIGNFYRKCNDFINYDKIIEGSINEPGLCPFLRFPITGITFEHAEDFCKWRTKVMGKGMVEFRLPTEQEWKEFALIGLSPQEKSNGFRDSIYSNGCPMYNYKYSNPCNRFVNAGLEFPRQIGVVRFVKENNGAFDVFGNVSEMTNVNGVSKGGNYETYASQCNVDSIQLFYKPEVWLGFRCIGIIK